VIPGDLIALIALWTVVVAAAYAVQRVVGKRKVEVYYGLALIVRGRETINKLLEIASRPLEKIPVRLLVVPLVALFMLTMLFFIPVPLLIVPGTPNTLFVFDHVLYSGTVLLLRNLVLSIEYFMSKLKPIELLEQGFLTLQPLVPGFTISFRTFALIVLTVGLSILVHEIAHGVVARRLKIPARSGGFFTSFFILLGGFVELEESELEHRPLRDKLAVFSAGVVANILLGLLALIVYIILSHITDLTGAPLGVVVTHSEIPKLHNGDIIVGINGYKIHSTFELLYVLPQIVLERPSKLNLEVLSQGSLKEVSVDLSGTGIRELLNLTVTFSKVSLLGGKLIVSNTLLYEILFWLVVLNITLAMFNALPAYPLDGGLVLQAVLEELTSRERARLVTYVISGVFWMLLVLSIILTFRTRLYVFIS